MATNRREFLKQSAVLTGAIGAGLTLPLSGCGVFGFGTPAPKPLRILILGGTNFIGPHQVRYAAARGHKITLFNRGRTNPGQFKGIPNIEERIGDRAPKPGNYDSLKTGEWDAVIDNPTTIPRWVREASEALKGRVNQYVFISTISVYAANDTPGADETAAVATTTTPDAEGTLPPNAQPGAVANPNSVAGNLYGPLKALSEKEAEKHFPGRTTVIRPGLIVGSGDATDRYTYWPVRISRGGEVLAPPPEDPVQFVDARDLSEWAIRCCEDKVFGTFNVTGPSPRKFTVREMVDGAKAALKSDAKITYVTREFLQEQGVRGGLTGATVLPVWMQPAGGTAGFMQRSIAKAVASGLTFRPYDDTVRETLAFYRSQPPERQATLRQGISAEKEQQVLAAWKAKG